MYAYISTNKESQFAVCKCIATPAHSYFLPCRACNCGPNGISGLQGDNSRLHAKFLLQEVLAETTSKLFPYVRVFGDNCRTNIRFVVQLMNFGDLMRNTENVQSVLWSGQSALLHFSCHRYQETCCRRRTRMENWKMENVFIGTLFVKLKLYS